MCARINLRFVENWYNLLNDVEAGFLKMKEYIEQALLDAETANQKVKKLKQKALFNCDNYNILYSIIYYIIFRGFYNQWADLSSFGSEQEETIRTAGYYAIDAFNRTDLKIVSINGNYGYNSLNKILKLVKFFS